MVSELGRGSAGHRAAGTCVNVVNAQHPNRSSGRTKQKALGKRAEGKRSDWSHNNTLFLKLRPTRENGRPFFAHKLLVKIGQDQKK